MGRVITTKHLPKISVIIPVAPGGSVESALRSLGQVEYPREKIEVIVAEGRQPAVQRNEAARRATGDILYFLDSDSQADIDLFRFVVRAFEDERVVVVGGPSEILESDSLFQRCAGYVLGSYFAVASVRCRYKGVGRGPRTASERMLILANMAVRRGVFREAGGFDSRLYPNEENEFLNRLLAKGYRLVYHPYARVRRPQRTSLGKFIQQMFTYGRGRMEHFRVSPQYVSPAYFLPLLFVLYVLSLPFAILLLGPGLALLAYLAPFGLYLHADAMTTLRILIDERELGLLLIVPFLFPVVHLFYALGMIWGMLKRMPRKPKLGEDAVKNGIVIKVAQSFSQ